MLEAAIEVIIIDHFIVFCKSRVWKALDLILYELLECLLHSSIHS